MAQEGKGQQGPRSSGSRDKAAEREQMSQKVRELIGNLLDRMPQSDLAKVAFTVKYWDDEDCPEEDFFIPPPPRITRDRGPLTGVLPRGSAAQEGSERLRRRRSKVRASLHAKSKKELVREITGDAKRMSYETLKHLSQSLLVLEKRRRWGWSYAEITALWSWSDQCAWPHSKILLRTTSYSAVPVPPERHPGALHSQPAPPGFPPEQTKDKTPKRTGCFPGDEPSPTPEGCEGCHVTA